MQRWIYIKTSYSEREKQGKSISSIEDRFFKIMSTYFESNTSQKLLQKNIDNPLVNIQKLRAQNYFSLDFEEYLISSRLLISHHKNHLEEDVRFMFQNKENKNVE